MKFKRKPTKDSLEDDKNAGRIYGDTDSCSDPVYGVTSRPAYMYQHQCPLYLTEIAV